MLLRNGYYDLALWPSNFYEGIMFFILPFTKRTIMYLIKRTKIATQAVPITTLYRYCPTSFSDLPLLDLVGHSQPQAHGAQYHRVVVDVGVVGVRGMSRYYGGFLSAPTFVRQRGHPDGERRSFGHSIWRHLCADAQRRRWRQRLHLSVHPASWRRSIRTGSHAGFDCHGHENGGPALSINDHISGTV